MRKVELSKEKIKYVAIGDSISEGYNSRYGFGYAGKYENGELTGISWPSFLVSSLLRINKKFVDWYENFSISGTRPEDWCYFLGINNKKYNYENSKKKIEFAYEMNNVKTNPDLRRLKNQFKNFGKTNQNDFNYFIDKIKDANLITITIGANYLIPKIPIEEITSLVLNKKDPKKVLAKLLSTIKTVEKDIDNMIKKIKELNPNSLIYLIGYNKMVSPFWELVDDFFNKFKLSKSITEFCVSKLNQSLKDCCKKNDVYYISTNNKEFINENAYRLYNIFYDIHPSVLGYKKIAQDVLVKMMLPDKEFATYENIIKKIPTFNKQYFLEDKNYFKNGLNISKTRIKTKDVIEKIYGKNNEALFSRTSSIEEVNKYLSGPIYFEQYLSPNNDPRQEIKISIKKSLIFMLSSSMKNFDQAIVDVNKLLTSDFLSSFIVRSNLISILVNNIQDEIDKYNLKNKSNLSKDEFKKIFLDQIFNSDITFLFLKDFAKYCIQSNSKTFASSRKIFLNLINHLVSRDSIKKLLADINKETFIYLMSKKVGLILNKENFTYQIREDESLPIIKQLKIFSEQIFNLYFNSLNEIKDMKNSGQLISFFMENKLIQKSIKLILKMVMSSLKISRDTTMMINELLNITNNNKNVKIMNDFYNNLISMMSSSQLGPDISLKMFSDFWINKKEFNLQNILNFLFDLDKNNFWNKLSKLKVSTINNEHFDNTVCAIDLIMNNIQFNGFIFTSIRNITNPPDLITKDNKIKIINLLKLGDKLLKSRFIWHDFFILLINKYYTSNLKTKDNIYYKTLFRMLLIVILILRQLLQKNVDKNIFMNGPVTIVPLVLSLAGYKHGKNKGIDNMILNMFNEDKNYDLEIKSRYKYDKNQVLRLIYNLDVNDKRDQLSKQEKEKIIFSFLKKGFID